MVNAEPIAHTQQKQKVCSIVSAFSNVLGDNKPSNINNSVAIRFISCNGIIPMVLILSQRNVVQQYLSKHACNHPFCSSVNFLASDSGNCTDCCALPLSHALIHDLHCVPSSALIYKIPARLTVAGVAYFKSRISKIIFIFSFSGILSFEGNVKILLSSITEFIDSIQFASKSPSNIIHFGLSSICPRSLIILLRTPSCHSRVANEV
mmetsp:Transcript_25091/g.29682  ORF Transcript_25091/g.29682 Transcript_25091/m.29682 type:complete len:207 (-) Transcript_25091:5748-6368(-)